MRAVGSNSWTVLWMCAPNVIQSKVTPAPRSPLGALTVTSLALEYQSGQAVGRRRCSQIFPAGAAILMVAGTGGCRPDLFLFIVQGHVYQGKRMIPIP